MNPTSENSGQASAPPARIVARLQRRSNSRRRSSAHSSRRSSISSLHSRASSLSCHGGPYSTHIAQHLRRASIIESRKARLAERAAHAEQVRLRAAAVKAAPRASNSEEKALAAQSAREKLLAEVAARCAEEVRRAKEVAEETREKKAAEHARLEAQMAEKFADAAKRRSMYQLNSRRPRRTSLAAVEEKKVEPARLGRNAAVRIIQRTWRASYARRIATTFREAGITVTNLKSLDFEDVTKLISTEDVMSASIRLMSYFGLLDAETDNTARRGAARVFLSAFMVVAHPVQTFSHGGQEPQEQDLIVKAQTLTSAIVENLSALIQNQSPAIPKDQLQTIFQDFTAGFHGWKTQDLGILADVWVASFVNFDLIIQATKEGNDENVAADYQDAIKTEQTKILVHLKRLLGPEKALERVRRAVKKARKDRAAQKANGTTEHVPRASMPANIDNELPTTAIPTPPATPKKVGQPEQVSSDFQKLEQTMTPIPSNREIAHEIQINGNFEIREKPWTKARQQYTQALKQKMRDTLQAEDTRTEANWSFSMVILVKVKLLQVVSPRHELYNKIDMFLDPKLVGQQVWKGIFVYNDFFMTIGNIIKQLCSPGRDDLVKNFCDDTTGDTIDRLFKLVNILDLMVLDSVNVQYRIISRNVRELGYQHEHIAFQKDLDNNICTLEKTEAFWSRGKTATSAMPGTASYSASIYARALTDLVLSNIHLTYDIVPETLRYDWLRLLKLRARVLHIVGTASILLTSKIRLRRNRESLWTREAEQLMKLDVMTIDASAIVEQIESGHMMPDSTRAGLMDFVSRVLPTAVNAATQAQMAEDEHDQAIRKKVEYDPKLSHPSNEMNTVFKEQIATYILKSLREHVYARLSASGTTERVRVQSSAAATMARIGMPEFLAEVNSVVDVLERVKAVDLKAHEKWYDEIATRASQPVNAA